ncbi:MAG: ATP-binding protein [Nitrospirales bacterium]|nr:ATP-binding protein [Nitrospirales bacterium]
MDADPTDHSISNGVTIWEDIPPSADACVRLQQQVADLTARLEVATRTRDRALADLEEKSSLEKALREKTHELARSNRDLDQFASVAAHDLQEPLHSISVFLDLLHIKYGSRLDSDGLRYVERMKLSASRMQQQVQGLLVYSKLDASPPPLATVSLSVLFEDIVSDLKGTIEKKEGVVIVGALPTLQGDSIHFRQLFQNLVQNALKFHQPGCPPVVRISGTVMVDRRYRGAGSPRKLCRVDITDKGIGIPSEQQHKIFGMFQRLHRNAEFDGVGIGLAICQRIVEHYRGEISLQSVPGKGSTFTVTLPESGDGLCP